MKAPSRWRDSFSEEHGYIPDIPLPKATNRETDKSNPGEIEQQQRTPQSINVIETHRNWTKHERWIGLAIAAFLGILTFRGCSFGGTPKGIAADGTSYVACSDLNVVEGWFLDPTISVTFKDVNSIEYTLKGVKKLEMVSLPSEVDAPFPTPMPDPITGTDKNGNHFIEGYVYTWSDGSKDRLHNGQWATVKTKNPVCVPKEP